jgi:copper(I)-binding protein
MRQVGIGLSAGLVLLWALTRIAGEPFARTADPVEWGLVASKSAEMIAAVALSAMILRDSAPRVLAGGAGVALAVCLVSYGGARIVEPFLPGLAEAPGEGPGHTHGAGQAAPINAAYANGMLISCAWVRPATAAEGSAALYFSITNLSGADDVLESVSTDAAGRAQIAQSREVAGGITQTALVEELEAPRGGPLILGPGGAMVLLVDVREVLASGQIVPVRLTFARAGVIEVRAEVVEAAVTPVGP